MEMGVRVVQLRQVKQWRPVMAGGCMGHALGMVIVSTTREWGEGGNQRQRNKEITEVHLEWLMHQPGSQAACAETDSLRMGLVLKRVEQLL
jgi:hypothetical protein